MPALHLDDTELFYETRGDGPPLVFLHGLGSSTRDWQLQLEPFSQRYRCVAFDLPGSGQSKDLAHPHGPFSLPGYAKVVAAAMKHLGIAPAHVVGLSMGGMTSLQLALDFPEVVRSITVVNAGASVIPRTLKERWLLGVRALVTKTLGPRGVAKLVAPRLFPRPEQAELRETFIRQMSTQHPRTYAAVSRAVMGWSVEARVGDLRCPTLLVAADADYTPVAIKEDLARRISGAKVVVVPDSHHALPVERPEAFNAVLAQFLDELGAP
jgi:pimeloyl-ACP methyl ester carboxylesterase